MSSAAALVAVTLGAALGSAARWWVMLQVARYRVAGGVAWVNVPAAAVAGAALGAAADGWPLAALLGICGGLSTYSSLALELAVAIRAREPAGLVLSMSGVLLGLAAGLGAAALGAAALGAAALGARAV